MALRLCCLRSLNVVRATGLEWGADNNLVRNTKDLRDLLSRVGSICLTLLNKNRNKCGLFANVNRATRIVISLRKKPSCTHTHTHTHTHIYIYIYHFYYLKTCGLLFGFHIVIWLFDLLTVNLTFLLVVYEL